MIQGFEFSGFGYPESSGVYMFCRSDLRGKPIEIVYIGSSINLQKRIKSHQNSKNEVFSSYAVAFMECQNFLEIERNLIKAYQPKFNKMLYKNA